MRVKASYKRFDARFKAIKLKPNFAEAFTSFCNVLKLEGKLQDAIDAHNKATKLKPDFAEAYSNLNAFKDQGKLEEAIEAHSNAIKLKLILPRHI